MLELLRELLHRKPFCPIRVIAKSGKRVEIDDPDRVAIGKSRVFVLPVRGHATEIDEGDIELVYQPRGSSHRR